jgi:hypothetical protein
MRHVIEHASRVLGRGAILRYTRQVTTREAQMEKLPGLLVTGLFLSATGLAVSGSFLLALLLLFLGGLFYLIFRTASNNRESQNAAEHAAELASSEAESASGISPTKEDYSESFESKWWRDHHRALWDARVTTNPIFTPSPAQLEEVLKAERREAREAALRLERLEAKRVNDKRSKNSNLSNRKRPNKQHFGVSARGAEELVADWIRYLGETEVRVTQYSKDGGIDVQTSTFCCQVKHYQAQKVGVEEVRALLGVAVQKGLRPLLFTSSELTSEALGFCRKTDIAVVRYNAEGATLKSLSPEGAKVMSRGNYEAMD